MSAETKQHHSFFAFETLIVSALFFIPVLSPAIFGWWHGLLAVPAVYMLLSRGMKSGTIQLGLCLTIAGVIALIVNRAEIMAFSLTMIPLGYILAQGARTGEQPAHSGGKGFAVLTACWLLFWLFFAVLTEVNPYTQLLQSIDTGLQEAGALYSAQESGLSEETRYSLKLLLDETRKGIPLFLPGILASIVLVTVWLNMLISNRLLERFLRIKAPWGSYASWKLPEHLVWLPIAAVLLILTGSGQIQHGGIWLFMLSAVAYLFQGLAVCLALLHRWHVPRYLRAVIFFVLAVQSYGLIVLALLGLSDVWIDFRRPEKEAH